MSDKKTFDAVASGTETMDDFLREGVRMLHETKQKMTGLKDLSTLNEVGNLFDEVTQAYQNIYELKMAAIQNKDEIDGKAACLYAGSYSGLGLDHYMQVDQISGRYQDMVDQLEEVKNLDFQAVNQLMKPILDRIEKSQKTFEMLDERALAGLFDKVPEDERVLTFQHTFARALQKPVTATFGKALIKLAATHAPEFLTEEGKIEAAQNNPPYVH